MRNLMCFLLLFTLAVGSFADKTTVIESTSNSSNESSTSNSPITYPSTSSFPPTTSTVPSTSTITTEQTTKTSETTKASPDTTTVLSTTKPSPDTTPSVPTTKTSDTTTETPKTSTVPPTSPQPPVTTKAPIPEPEETHWNVTDGNTTCIRATLKIRFKISVLDRDDYIVLSQNATADESKCRASNVTETLQLQESHYKVIFTFEKDADSVYLKETEFHFQLPGIDDTVSNDTHMFNVKSGNSYLCKTSTNVMLGNVTMEIFKIQIQAFGSAGNSDFGTVEECVADNVVNDIVPIAVGVALLALVVVVLIAYLVGRRRSRQKGYQSV